MEKSICSSLAAKFFISCFLVLALSADFVSVHSKVVLPSGARRRTGGDVGGEGGATWNSEVSTPYTSQLATTAASTVAGNDDFESAEGSDPEIGLDDEDPSPNSAHNENDYLDDGVTFVTDEEVLYDYQSQGSSSFPTNQNSNAYHQRGRESRVTTNHPDKCPPLPDTSVSGANLRLCEMRECQHDEDCSRDSSFVCCYNGCIHSCLPKVNPPVAFDWLEETVLMNFPPGITESGPDFILSSLNKNVRNLMDVEVSPDEIALPGGCFINPKQYEDLILFRKFEHVKSCTCSKGEVFCEVNTLATRTESG